MNQLLRVVECGSVDQLRGVLQEANREDIENMVVLYTAVERRHMGILEALLRAGADPDVYLNHAVANGHLEMAKMFLVYGADPNNPSEYASSLAIAAASRNVDMVELLLHHGADPQGREGEATPMAVAIQHRVPEIVSLLLDHGADPNIDRELHFAVRRGGGLNMDMASLLLQAGADPNLRDYEGETPLHIAARQGDEFMIQLLIRWGGRMDIPNRHGDTPQQILDRVLPWDLV